MCAYGFYDQNKARTNTQKNWLERKKNLRRGTEKEMHQNAVLPTNIFLAFVLILCAFLHFEVIFVISCTVHTQLSKYQCLFICTEHNAIFTQWNANIFHIHINMLRCICNCFGRVGCDSRQDTIMLVLKYHHEALGIFLLFWWSSFSWF